MKLCIYVRKRKVFEIKILILSSASLSDSHQSAAKMAFRLSKLSAVAAKLARQNALVSFSTFVG